MQPALDFASLAVASANDAALLIEVTATDGALLSVGGADVLGVNPVGILPGGLTGGDIRLDWSDVDWTSRPTDARPNVHFEGRAGDVAIERAIPLRPDSDRRVAAALSEISVVNADGALDGVDRTLAVDGRPVVVSLLAHRSNAYAARRVVFSGIGREWRAGPGALRLTSASLGYLLDVPMLATYAGTGGAQGGADLTGKPVQEVHGRCRGVSLVLEDAARLIYRVSARPANLVSSVYVRGAPVTYGTLRADYAALAATAPSGGFWDWAIAADGTWVRLGSSADGPVTADVDGDAVMSAAALLRRILDRAGASYSGSTLDSLAAQLPARVGRVFAEQLTFADALSQIARGSACWWGDAGDGVITAARLAAPGGGAGILLDEESILGEVEPLEAPSPAWRVTVRYRRNWTPLAVADVVPPPTVTEARRQELTQPSRSVAVAQPERRQRHALAQDMTLDIDLDEEADAVALATNMLSLYAPGRRLFRVPLGLAGWGLTLGQQARLVWPRLGLASGLDVRVVAQSARGRACDVTVMG